VQRTQEQKAVTFAALHEGDPFIIPNPWDAGSAKVLEALGFKALATTSSGFAFTLGRQDGGATLDELAEHVASLDRATSLPISVDLENGYGPDPAAAATAIERAASAGAVGGSIEDYDPAARSTRSSRPPSASPPPARRRAPSPSRSRSRLGRRTTSAGTRTSTTRSLASRRTSKPEQTSFTPPASPRPTRSARCARRSRSRSTCSRAAT